MSIAGGRLPHARAALRRRPRLQGALLAPRGALLRLPDRTDGMWFPFYHDVPAELGSGLRRHLEALLARGRFLSWSEALDRLASPDALSGPHFCLSFDDGHKDWLSNVVPLLLSLNIPATFFITIDKVVEGFSESRLTWADCNRLLADGMALGSHSLTHPRLALVDSAAARREVEQSRQELEQRTGAAVLDFSAPFGLPGVDFGERELELVQAAGYRSFASAKPGVMHPGESPYRIARSGLSPAWPLPAVRVRVHERREGARVTAPAGAGLRARA